MWRPPGFRHGVFGRSAALAGWACLALLGCATPCEDAAAAVCTRLWTCTTEHNRAKPDFLSAYGETQADCAARLATACRPACVSACQQRLATHTCDALDPACLASCP